MSRGKTKIIVVSAAVLVLIAALLFLPALLRKQRVYSAVEGVKISPLLVSTNLWHYPLPEVWETCEGTGLRLIRIGGIEYENNFPSNRQLASWVNQIKSIDAEPMIQMSSHLTPEEAAEVVHYFNVETKNDVKYWNIGNEPWIEAGMTNDHLGLAAEVEQYVKALASAMKAIDPDIRIFAPDEAFYIDTMYEALLGGQHDITGKDEQGNYYIDGVSFHQYIGFPPESLQVEHLTTLGVDRFQASMAKVQERLAFANQRQNRQGEDALQWGIGEMNSATGPRVKTFENGQMFGQVYGLAMEYGAHYAASWSMFENGGDGGATDFSLLDYSYRPRPHFYHMQLISKYFNGLFIKADSTESAIRSFAAVDGNRLSVMVMNIDTSGEQQCTISLDESLGHGSTITIPAGIAVQHVENMESQTTKVLVFNLSGKLVERVTYSSSEHFTAKRPPTVEEF